MSENRHSPSIRKPLGILAILALIAIWAAMTSELAEHIVAWPMVAQIIFYLIAGLAWIAPLKPLLRWMETGRFRT